MMYLLTALEWWLKVFCFCNICCYLPLPVCVCVCSRCLYCLTSRSVPVSLLLLPKPCHQFHRGCWPAVGPGPPWPLDKTRHCTPHELRPLTHWYWTLTLVLNLVLAQTIATRSLIQYNYSYFISMCSILFWVSHNIIVLPDMRRKHRHIVFCLHLSRCVIVSTLSE